MEVVTHPFWFYAVGLFTGIVLTWFLSPLERCK
jgi:hypothetical protein